jgi:hypothetical protein
MIRIVSCSINVNICFTFLLFWVIYLSMLSSITCGFRSTISSIWFDASCIEIPPRLSSLTPSPWIRTCTWHKHSKCHAESVWFLSIDLGHVTHFSRLGALKVRHWVTAYDWLIQFRIDRLSFKITRMSTDF